MNQWLQRLHQPVLDMGWFNGSLFIGDLVLARLSGRRVRLYKYHLVAQPVMPPEPALRPGADTELLQVLADDPLRLEFPRPQAVIDQRYADGARCFVVRVKSQFAGYLWLLKSGYREDEVRCDYLLSAPEISVWDYDVYVAPRYRLGRTLARLWAHAATVLHQEGVRWTFSRISAYNPESIKAHARLDARILASGLFIRLGSWQLSLLNCKPFVHLSLHAGQRPQLHLSPPP